MFNKATFFIIFEQWETLRDEEWGDFEDFLSSFLFSDNMVNNSIRHNEKLLHESR